MNHYFEAAKNYTTTYKKELIIGTAVLLGCAAIVAAIVFFVYSDGLKIVYQPAKACDMLTPAKAEDLLGNKVISTDKNEPTISGDVATSKCSYTDRNPDQNKMMVAAIAVRSGINDKGTEQNKTEFAKSKPSEGVETVKNLGESAYFNHKNGQLNILDGHKWILLSYGVGAAPQANTLDKAIELAHKILN